MRIKNRDYAPKKKWEQHTGHVMPNYDTVFLWVQRKSCGFRFHNFCRKGPEGDDRKGKRVWPKVFPSLIPWKSVYFWTRAYTYVMCIQHVRRIVVATTATTTASSSVYTGTWTRKERRKINAPSRPARTYPWNAAAEDKLAYAAAHIRSVTRQRVGDKLHSLFVDGCGKRGGKGHRRGVRVLGVKIGEGRISEVCDDNGTEDGRWVGTATAGSDGTGST